MLIQASGESAEMDTGTARAALPLQRAEGMFAISARLRDGQTRRGILRQGGCSRLLFPCRDETQLEAVMVNISGGLAAGDHLRNEVRCEEGAELLMSSQGHERVYRARPEDPPAVIHTDCHLAPQSRLEWLPHGTIFFNGARLERSMTVEMAGTASFLFYESRILGRRGSGEQLQHLHLRDRLSIRRDGRPVLEDSTIMMGDGLHEFFQQSPVADGACMDTTLVLVDRDAESYLPRLRPLLEDVGPEASFAASCWDGKLVIRGLARTNWVVESLMHRLLPCLRAGRRLPTGWRI